MESLHYESLVDIKCLPDIINHMQKGKRYPQWIYKNKFVEQFDKHARKYLLGLDSQCELPENIEEIIQKNTTELKETISENSFIYCVDNSVKDFGPEIMKAFSYVKEKQVQFLVFVFPLVNKSVKLDITKWNNTKFKKTLELSESWITDDNYASTNKLENPTSWFYENGMGTHVTKNFNPNEVNIWFNAIQIFLSNPQSTKCSVDSIYKDIEKFEELTVPVFVHAPYILNIAANRTHEKECLIKTLTMAKLVGARGVVIHVGKKLKISYSEALKNSLKSIREVLPHASPECPLLLETPAGQGTETLTMISSFIKFCNSIDSPNFGICIDTCHVFSSGYCPLWFLNETVEKCKAKVALVHFNDSIGVRGCRKDRHEQPGLGHIGFERLKKVHARCNELGIPMVRE